jgi:hypothetical protein
MTREAHKLLREHEAVEAIIRDSKEPEIVKAAEDTRDEIERKLRLFNVHPGSPRKQ